MFASFLSQHLGGHEADHVFDKILQNPARCFFTSLFADDLCKFGCLLAVFEKEQICKRSSPKIPAGGRLNSPPSQAGAWNLVKRCETLALFFNIPASGGAVIAGRSGCKRKPSDVWAANLRGGHAREFRKRKLEENTGNNR